jgi:hypothetical protein
VASCAGAPCHGKVTKGNKVVWQTEYTLWKQTDNGGNALDQHADAFRHLTNSRSKEIARKLGIGAPEEADLCLDCHADNVPAARRGEKFKLDMGVGCEACHGGSERWIKPHDTALRPHPKNLADGMYPTDQPVAQAELCSSCHVGTRDKFVTHRMMAAGHPRMKFELLVYTLTRHTHFDWDTVAIRNPQREKRVAAGIQFWAIGQAVIAKRQLELLLDSERGFAGIWPELVLYDCHSCHHKMADARWQPRASIGHPPGSPHWNDSSLLMVRHALAAAAPEEEEGLAEASRGLHQAALRGSDALRSAARNLVQRLDRAIARLDSWQPSTDAVRRALASLLAEGSRGEYLDPAAGEQAALASQALIDNLRHLGALSPTQAGAMMDIAADLAARLDNHENYDRAATRAACAKLASLLSKPTAPDGSDAARPN